MGRGIPRFDGVLVLGGGLIDPTPYVGRGKFLSVGIGVARHRPSIPSALTLHTGSEEVCIGALI